MKIKKLMALCKKQKCIYVYHIDRDIFVGNQTAIYAFNQSTEVTSSQLCELFDINDISCYDTDTLPQGINTSDITELEVPCEILPIRIVDGGNVLIALNSVNGVAFINSAALSPLSDVPDEDISIYERFDGSGYYYVIKIGMLFAALVLPVNVINNEFEANLSRLSHRVSGTLSKRSEMM